MGESKIVSRKSCGQDLLHKLAIFTSPKLSPHTHSQGSTWREFHAKKEFFQIEASILKV